MRKSTTGEMTGTFQLPIDAAGWTSVSSGLHDGRLAVAALVHGEPDRVTFLVARVPDGHLVVVDEFPVPRDETTWFRNKVHVVPEAGAWVTLRGPGSARVYAW